MLKQKSFPRSAVCTAVTCALLITNSTSVFAETAIDSSSIRAEKSSFDNTEYRTSQMNFGGVGLMQMPTGRMAPEGEFNFSASFNNEYYFYNVSLQVMPWLETTIRYTQVQDLLYSGGGDQDCSQNSFSGCTKYTDKGIDFKLRLIEEGYYLPEVSVGVRDFGGTGLFDGEFVAATKRFGPVDFTLGMAWGYMGTSGNFTNPLCKASDKYCERPSDYKGNGGSVDFDRWFKGDAAIYGGFEYQTPYKPLTLKLEYDGNDYSQDFPVVRGGVDMTQHTPWNVGAVYRFTDWGSAKVSYERGDTLTLGFDLSTNFNEMYSVWRDTETTELRPSDVETVDDIDMAALAEELETIAGYEQAQILVDDNSIVVKGTQVKYRDRDIALERGATVIANAVPSYIDTYKIIENDKSLELTETTVDAQAFKAAANNSYLNAQTSDATDTHELERKKSVIYHDGRERFDVSISPNLAQSFGSAENFYLYSLGLYTNASFWALNNVELSGSLYVNLVDNYDKFNYEIPSDGTDQTPRVRTLFRSYVDDPVRLDRLQLTWFEDYGSGVYTQAYGGYLESMFAGVGGEILYRPFNQNWAIGADMTAISQRDPESWFGTFDQEIQINPDDSSRTYKVIDKGTTGFITGYYTPQWDFLSDTLLKVGVGKFLAGDIGTRVDFSKQFKSGVIAGAFVSLTDMTTEEYGEGSYTKGFYVSIPFDLVTVKPSSSRAGFTWLPITRDGGQVLNKQYNLFDQTDARSPWFQRPSSVN
ncbi:YjbH domain-containing protein [Vibrio lentus]|uniref:YjbH domain-containing protein n=1 Tax=Vibrio lentus TaxID=136468 RepID=A0AA44VY73_9VIBR|nr:YjbH domain-containing protein [Vibrio lentus]MCB5361881.1 YjbH domain-containing protein [Vibrio lentus]MCB5447645.1 YjbH domain-containing protein [Vibrio lentus]MCB5464271.1 YjbH domain-containing protein [Vibrio lentus]MCC4796272.1 YjbH domain-containing protein [Vibrio lentus]MCC4853547.1 YjbH domain-containing protein [Vibrio lentus]